MHHFIMKLAVCRPSAKWRFLSLLVIVATVTFLGLLKIQTDWCATTPVDASYANNLLVEASDGHKATSGRNNEPYLLDHLRKLNTTEIPNRKGLFFSSELLTQNISKFGQDWFKAASEEDYLAANLTVFIKSKAVKTILNDSYLIKGDDVCKGSSPFVLVIIPSVASNIAERDVIRWTWLRAAETNFWPRAFIRDNIKHIFLFGHQASQGNEDYRQLLNESTISGDIVMVDFDDTYRNLTRKILSGLRWVRQYCPQAQFVLKADQDTFINIPLMMEVLHQAAATFKNESFVMGLQHIYEKPLVVRDGKWAVSKEEYPLDFYPRYFYGHTYALNKKAVIDITDTVPYLTLIAPEDAFITGILPKVSGVSRIKAPSFTVCCRQIYDCEVVWNQKVALPEVKNPSLLAQLWTNLITHQCSDNKTFIG